MFASMLLNNLFKGKTDEYLTLQAWKTGFTVFDVHTASLEQDMRGYPVVNGGLFPRLINIIGTSGSGKSTFAIEACAGAIDTVRNRYGNGLSELLFFDTEHNTSPKRIMDVTGWNNETFLGSCKLSHKDLSLIDLANTIFQIADFKKKNKKDLIVPSGIKDVSGNEVMSLAPTFILIDSLAAVNPNGVEDDRSTRCKSVDYLC